MFNLIISAFAFIVGFGIGLNVGYIKGTKNTGRCALEFFDKNLKKNKIEKIIK